MNGPSYPPRHTKVTSVFSAAVKRRHQPIDTRVRRMNEGHYDRTEGNRWTYSFNATISEITIFTICKIAPPPRP